MKKHSPLEIYFEEKIHDAVNRQNARLSINAINYLINLISHEALRGSSENIYLFDLYKKSIEANSRSERIAYLKMLGDHSLVTSGFFSRSLERKPAGVNYYISMGSAAYSSIMDPEIYLELGVKYKQCVSLLNEVSESNHTYCINDIGRLYSLWMYTDSKTIQEELLMLGMVMQEVHE